VVEALDNAMQAELLLYIPVEDIAYNRGFRFADVPYAAFLITPIAVQIYPIAMNLPVLEPGPLAPQGSFSNLLYLDPRGIATHETNQLAFRGMVKRFRDKLDDYPVVLCLT
jgi:hypothetical protein